MALLLPKIHFLDLMWGATQDGYADLGFDAPGLDASSGRAYSGLLTSLLLHGGASVAVRPEILEGLECQRLIDEGLVEFDLHDPSAAFHQSLVGLYESAFDHLRQAESDPLVAPIVSLDAVDSIHRSTVDLETNISEANYSASRLDALLSPVVDQFNSEFVALLSEEQRLNHQVLLDRSPMNPAEAGLFLPRSASPDEDFDTSSIFYDLGLRVLTPQEYEWGGIGLPYGPNDLRKIWVIECALTGRGGTFEEHAEAALMLGMRGDPERFLRTHSFWVAVLDLYRAVELSKLHGHVLPVASIGDPMTDATPMDMTIADLPRDRLGLFRTVLLDRGSVPRVRCVEDVLRLRDDVRFQSLQYKISEWQQAIASGQIEDIADLRNAVASQADVASRSLKMDLAGRFLTWVSAPIAAYDASRGSLLGLPVALVAPLADIAIRRNERRHSWVRLGT